PGKGDVALAVAVAVWPAAFLATSVKVVSPVTVTFVDPDRATPAPLIVAEVAFAVCQVTVATLFAPRVAGICAVGAVGVRAPGLTIVTAVAVWPAALRATMVKLVSPFPVIVALPANP